jgi:hypothetical protein
MLSDPTTITVNAVAQAMPRVSQNGTSSLYRKTDGTFRLEVSHQMNEQKRARNTTSGVQTVKQTAIRSLVKFVKRAIVADPVSSTNDYEELAIQLVIIRPEVGFTATDLDQCWAGFKTWLDSTQSAKIFGLES